MCDIAKDGVYDQHIGNNEAWRVQIRTTKFCFVQLYYEKINYTYETYFPPNSAVYLTRSITIISHDSRKQKLLKT